MPRYEVRNKVSRVVLGEVVVGYGEDVLSALARDTQSTIDEIAHSFGKTADEAKAALEIVALPDPPPAPEARQSHSSGKGKLAGRLPPRQLYR